MPNRYSCKWVELLGKLNNCDYYAITLGQTTYYSTTEHFVDTLHPDWRIHEDYHKIQWARDGIIKFAILYLWYLFFRGYYNNPYEIEARAAVDLELNRRQP